MLICSICSFVPMIRMISSLKPSTLLGRSLTTCIDSVIWAWAKELIELIKVAELWLSVIAPSTACSTSANDRVSGGPSRITWSGSSSRTLETGLSPVSFL